MVAGLIATVWLWCYAERSNSSRTSSASLAEGNGIVQPLLAEENGSSNPSQPQRNIHPDDAIEAQQDEVVTQQSGAGAAAAPGVDEQRKDSSSSSSSRSSSPQTEETLVGETMLEGDKGQEASLDSLAAIQQPEEGKTPPAAQDDNGDSEDPPAGIEGSNAGAGVEELGEPTEVLRSSG